MNLNIVILGLSVTSSWGNGHATTYRALIAALAQRGHHVTFLERDVPWYRSHRDLERPSTWEIRLYQSLNDIPRHFGKLIRDAHLVIIGSYVLDGVAISDWVTSHARGVTAFYDIDTPVTLAALDEGTEYISRAMIPRFDLYLSFSGGPVPDMIERRYGSPLSRTLYCSADPALYRREQAKPHWSLGYLGTYSVDRQPLLEQLLLAPAAALPDHKFVVAGAQYPADLAWNANIERIEHLAPSEHRSFYSRQRFALNLTRAHMRALGYSPSVRLFEAAACGTPIISDRWSGIETIFTPDKEILLVSRPEEIIQILRDMPDDRRRSIAEQARRRVIAEHTPAHRACKLESYYLEAARRRSRTADRPGADRQPRRSEILQELR
jgi:spore maturation protein CgeB